MDNKYIPVLLKCELFNEIDQNSIIAHKLLKASCSNLFQNDYIVQTGIS